MQLCYVIIVKLTQSHEIELKIEKKNMEGFCWIRFEGYILNVAKTRKLGKDSAPQMHSKIYLLSQKKQNTNHFIIPDLPLFITIIERTECHSYFLKL